MKFLYVAPRFHPNQYPIIKGLIEKGHEVRFLVSRVGETEKHGEISVVVAENSGLTKYLHKQWSKKGSNYAEDKMLFWFQPKKKAVKNLLKDYEPDVVILRDRNLFSLSVYRCCKSLGIKKVLLYNQSPIYAVKESFNLKNVFKKGSFYLFPQKRITVCRYRNYPDASCEYQEDSKAYFLPFIARDSFDVSSRVYTKENIVRIFDCGKYRDYKNHHVLVDAAKKLIDKGFTKFFVTIVGQISNANEQQYYDALKQYIEKLGLTAYFSLNGSVPYDEMPNLYLNHDVFVLTSIRELANISILDSMSYGLATVATSANGTSDYVGDGESGFVFKTGDAEDLSLKLQQYLENPALVKEHGENGLKQVKENHSFESYYEKFMMVINEL